MGLWGVTRKLRPTCIKFEVNLCNFKSFIDLFMHQVLALISSIRFCGIVLMIISSYNKKMPDRIRIQYMALILLLWINVSFLALFFKKKKKNYISDICIIYCLFVSILVLQSKKSLRRMIKSILLKTVQLLMVRNRLKFPMINYIPFSSAVG